MKRTLLWALTPLIAAALLLGIALLAFLSTLSATAGACGTAPTSATPAGGPSTVAGIPSNLLPIYEQAAAKYQLGGGGWAYLASINYQETGFGTNLSVSSAGAKGWMQFEPATWAQYGQDANHDGTANSNDPWDAIFAAAHYLHDSGAPGNWSAAIFTYNHAGWYVSQVTNRAQQYLSAAGGAGATSSPPVTATPAGGSAPGLLTDAGGIVAATIYGNSHDDNGLGAYHGESLAGDFAGHSPPFAELGGTLDAHADLLGHLAPGTGVQITNPLNGRSITAYKHDFGYGQGSSTLQGHRYRIDLWWQTAYALGIHDSALVKLQIVGSPITTSTGANCQPSAAVGTVPGATARILPDGSAQAPADAPPAVQNMIAAGNRLIHFGYSYGGGHCVAAMNQQHPNPASSCAGNQENGYPGYDCSAAVSYVLWGGGLAGLLGGSPLTSGDLTGVGDPGPGRWVSWYANSGHVYMQVAGIYMNSENGEFLHMPPQPPSTGPRWDTANSLDSPNRATYVVRHPPGL